MTDMEEITERNWVVGWRFEQLVKAGYSQDHATILSERMDVDLHEAVELVVSGCKPATAFRILL